MQPMTGSGKSQDTSESGQLWERFNQRKTVLTERFPTEWVVRTLAGGNYPSLKLDKARYPGARMLDLGAGDGRNLPLLTALGFKMHATEISEGLVSDLKELAYRAGWALETAVGKNSSIPFPDRYFDYVLSCSSCYYLDEHDSWSATAAELARVIVPGGLFIGNLPDPSNSLLKDGEDLEDGSVIIRHDPFRLRNGLRFMVARSPEDVARLLRPHFVPLAVGYLNDDYYGLGVSCYIFVAKRV